MIRRMVLAHRPHWALHPRQRYTSPVDRGGAAVPESAPRTSWSVNTLQEQTIILEKPGRGLVSRVTICIMQGMRLRKKKFQFLAVLILR